MRKFEKNHPYILSPDAFRQALQKYALRHAKGDAKFSLISVEVGNFQQLAESGTTETASHVCEILLRECLHELRHQDRACFPTDDLFLFLLPEADQSVCKQAEQRIARVLAEFRHTLHGKVVKLDGLIISTDCGETVCDIDAMLHSVGATLDEHGGIVKQASKTHRLQMAKFDSWAQRFDEFTALNGEALEWTPGRSTRDRWSGLPVRISKLDLPLEASLIPRDEVVKRARTLQSIDHPALNRLIDFHCDEQLQAVFLVWHQREGRLLSEFLSQYGTVIESSKALRWIAEIVSALTYLQALVPPAVPTDLTVANVLEIGDDIVIDNVLESYVLHSTPAQASAELFSKTAHLLETILRKTDTAAAPAELTQVIAQLKQPELPQKLNTMHKVRAVIRKIVERVDKEDGQHHRAGKNA